MRTFNCTISSFLFLLVVVSANGQSRLDTLTNSVDSVYSALRAVKFERQCLEGNELIPFKREAKDILERLKGYFSVLANSGGVHPRKIPPIERRIEDYLKNYEGVFFAADLTPRTEVRNAKNYIAYLKSFAQSELGMINICWGDDVSEITFEEGSSDRIGHANGNIPAEDSETQTLANKDSLKGFYCVIKGSGYYQEEVTYFKDNDIQRVTSCKKITFYLRFMQIGVELDGQPRYGWELSASIIENADSKDCKVNGVADIENECAPPKIDCDSLNYVRVPGWTYLVPGLGWSKLNPNRRFKIWPVITLLSVGGMGYGLYQKIFKSMPAYNDHLTAATIKGRADFYEVANDHHHRFIIAAGGGLLLWAASDFLIWRTDSRKSRQFDERFRAGCKDTNEATTLLNGNTVRDQLRPRIIHQLRPIPLFDPFSLGGMIPGIGYQVTF